MLCKKTTPSPSHQPQMPKLRTKYSFDRKSQRRSASVSFSRIIFSIIVVTYYYTILNTKHNMANSNNQLMEISGCSVVCMYEEFDFNNNCYKE